MSTFRRRLMSALGGGDRSDLSMFDIYGNPIAQTTANCYIVKESGQYRFPLVYGCALKNGSANSESYTNGGGTHQHDFVAHDGSVIASPYIEAVVGSAASAQLTIADTDGIFTDISIIEGSPCRYVQFSIASVPATGANGVISVKNSSGVIMWSWHIWVWEDDLTPVGITNKTGYIYNILPVNLGSKWDNTAKTRIKNWFYQFGRPTPFLCPSSYNSTTRHESYGALSFIYNPSTQYIYDGILNPTTFYLYNSNKGSNWFETNYDKAYNLWDAECSGVGRSDNNVVKTIYDPCPTGFKMPNGNTFTGCQIIKGSNKIIQMTRYDGDTVGVGFPLSGSYSATEGILSNVGSYGDVWTSAFYSSSGIFLLYFNSGAIQDRQLMRAYGFSVRPVQE